MFNIKLVPHSTLSKHLCCTNAGGAEIYRNGELDPEKRIYPGGLFDPLGLASEGSDRTAKLREAEIKHGGTPPDAEVRIYLVYLKYWTLHLIPLKVYPKVLFHPNISIKGDPEFLVSPNGQMASCFLSRIGMHLP